MNCSFESYLFNRMSGYRDNCGLLYLDMKTVDEKDDPLRAVSPNSRYCHRDKITEAQITTKREASEAILW
jgi:hypothetical protein